MGLQMKGESTKMPKVNMATKSDNREYLVRVIRSKIELYGLKRTDVAKAMLKDERTLSNRYKDPGSFTLDEIIRVCKKLKMEVVINENGVECR